VSSVSARLTGLAIDFDDTYMLSVRHENGSVGQFTLDVVSRKATRSLEVFDEEIFLTWDGKPGGLFDCSAGTGDGRHIATYETVMNDPRYADNIVENAYVDEMRAFFDTLEGKPARRHSFEDDRRLLKLIDEIEGR